MQGNATGGIYMHIQKGNMLIFADSVHRNMGEDEIDELFRKKYSSQMGSYNWKMTKWNITKSSKIYGGNEYVISATYKR